MKTDYVKSELRALKEDGEPVLGKIIKTNGDVRIMAVLPFRIVTFRYSIMKKTVLSILSDSRYHTY